MSNWISLNPNTILPTGLQDGVSNAGPVYRKYLEMIQADIEAAKRVQSLISVSPPDVIQTTVQAVVDAVEGLLQAGKLHSLFIPIGKIFPTPKGYGLPSTLVDLGRLFGATETEVTANLDPKAKAAYAKALTKGGGNAGFLQTFAASLADHLDPHRPQYYKGTDAVVMAVVLGGSATFAGAVELAAGLNRIFRPAGNDDLAARTLPTPQGLHAKVIGVPSGTSIGVRLDWNAPKPKFSGTYYPGVLVSVTRYAVIRSADESINTAKTVLDLFPTRDLKKGLESSDKKHKVIAVGTGSTSTYIDNETLDSHKVYYYTVVWELEVIETGTTTTIPFDQISTIIKTSTATTTATQDSQPPDWHSLPSALDILPSVSQQTLILLERLKALSTRNIGTPAIFSAAMDHLTRNLEAQLARIDNLSKQLAQLTVTFNQPLPALYSTLIIGVGGNTKLVGDLSARLFDYEDPSRPPFDGNEYVTGICMVAGGPRLADFSAVTNLLNALFSSSESSNPLVTVLDTIDVVVSAQEAAVLGPDFRPLTRGEPGTVIVPPSALPRNPDGTADTTNVVASDDGNYIAEDAAINPLTGNVASTPRPVVGEDGATTTADAATNPNAGKPNPCS